MMDLFKPPFSSANLSIKKVEQKYAGWYFKTVFFTMNSNVKSLINCSLENIGTVIVVSPLKPELCLQEAVFENLVPEKSNLVFSI